MPDVTLCKSKKCPLRKKCYRATAKADKYQSYFVDEDLFKIDGKHVICEYFWQNDKLKKSGKKNG